MSVAAWSAVLASSALGQARSGASCDSAIRASAVSAERIVQLVISPGKRGGKLPRPFAAEFLERLADEFRLPARISVPRYSSPDRLPTDSLGRGAGTWAFPDLYVLVRIALESSGIARRIEPLELSGDARIDSTIVGAVHSILSDSAWLNRQRVANQLSGDSSVLDIELDVGRVLTKKERDNRDKRIADGELLVLRLARLRLPHYPNAVLAALPRDVSEPLYPGSQSFMNKAGYTLLHAVLDTNGAVVPASVWFGESTHRDFEDAVRLWLPVARYRPARIGGCPVPVRIAQPFNFRIR